jgi:hypothetical protein
MRVIALQRSRTLEPAAGNAQCFTTLAAMKDTLAAMVGLHPFAGAPRREQVEAYQRTRFTALKESRPAQAEQSLRTMVTWAARELRTKWCSANDPASAPAWAQPAAELVALQLVQTLGNRVGIIRKLIGVLTVDSLVLLLVTRLYPFQPRSFLSRLSWFLLLAVVAVSVWTLLEMERHAVLSRASGSDPGKISWDASLVTQLVLFAVLPLIALVAAHFPEVGGPIFEALQPLIRSAR